MSDPLQLAVVGAGRMGASHAENLAAMDVIDVVAVADTRPGVAREVGQTIGSASHDSSAALLERDDVEAWLIASSTPSHADLVGSALDAGLHVLCEKPLSLHFGESEGQPLPTWKACPSSGRLLYASTGSQSRGEDTWRE